MNRKLSTKVNIYLDLEKKKSGPDASFKKADKYYKHEKFRKSSLILLTTWHTYIMLLNKLYLLGSIRNANKNRCNFAFTITE